MELKEIYIAPEVELLLFRPVETLANDFMTGWNFTGGSGETGNEGEVVSQDPGGGGENTDEVEDP